MILYNDRIITNSVGKWFQRPLHMVTTHGNHGSVNANPNMGEFGTNVTLSNTPDTGYNFTGYSIAGDGASLSGNTLIIGYSDVSVTGNFGINTYSITYSSVANGSFTGPSSATYGSTVTITANPSSGYKLNYITVNGVRITGNTFTMPAGPVTISGSFAVDYNPLNLPPYTIRIKVEPGFTPSWVSAYDGWGDSGSQVSGQTDVWDIYCEHSGVRNIFINGKESKVYKILGANLGDITDLYGMCAACINLTSVAIFDTSNATTMEDMFAGCESLTTVPLFDTSKVTKFTNMFGRKSYQGHDYYCHSLTSVPLFDMSSAVTTERMFFCCSSLINVPTFNTSNVTNMYGMFDQCSSLTTVPLLDTSKVTTMGYMFNQCTSLTSVPKFNTASVTNMYRTFRNCTSLTTVPLFNTSSVTSMDGTFGGCTSLTSVPQFNTANVTTVESMFNGCSSLTTIPLFNTSNVTTMGTFCTGCNALTRIPLFNTSKVRNVIGAFGNCWKVQSGALALYNQMANQTNPPSSHRECFYRCGRDTTSGAAELAQIPDDWK